jgi:hypothetical protein
MTTQNKNLETALERNSGYNPERAADHGDYHLSADRKTLMIGDHAFSLTDATSMLDYVTRYPRRFGLTVGNRFYIEDEI